MEDISIHIYRSFWSEYNQKVEELKNDTEYKNLQETISDIQGKIHSLKNEIKKCSTKKSECDKTIAGLQRRYEKDLFVYMGQKLNAERTGKRGVTPLDQDETILRLGREKDSAIQEKKRINEEWDNEQAQYKQKLYDLQNKLKPLEEKRNSILEAIKEAEEQESYYWKLLQALLHPEETSLSDSSDSLDSSYSSSPSYSSSSSYSSSPSYSSSSYDSDRYAREQREQAEALKAQAREMEEQTRLQKQQADEARRQTDLLKRQMEESKRQMEKMEREAKERRLEEERRRKQQEEAARREANRIRRYRYYGVVYFKDGRTIKTPSSDMRQDAERMAQREYDLRMRTATNDFFKPSRYEVVSEEEKFY